MEPFKLVVDGTPIVKKNTMKSTWYKTIIQNGVRKQVPLKFPIKYYTAAYLAWAKTAVEKAILYKNKELNVFPITSKVSVTILFFIDYDGKVDLTNLSEGIMDVISGKSGLKLSKKSGLVHDSYKLIEDDSQQYVKFNSMFSIYDPIRPRMEIFVSPYNISALGSVMKHIHPKLKIDFDNAESDQESLFGNKSVDLFESFLS